MPSPPASTPSTAGENLGRLARVDLAGFAAGPIIGRVLFSVVGLRGTFVFFAVVAAVAFVLLIPRSLPSLATSAESSRPSLTLLRRRRVVVATLLALAVFLPVGVFDSLWDRYLTDLGGSNLVVGLTFALYALPFVALTAYGGRLADRVGHVRISLCGLALLAPLTALYGTFRSIPVLVLLPMLEAVGQAATVPASQAAMAAACPPGRAAAGQGLAARDAAGGRRRRRAPGGADLRGLRPHGAVRGDRGRHGCLAVLALVLHSSANRADALPGAGQRSRSMSMAIPWPPPTHIDSRPIDLSSLCSPLMSVAMMRAPGHAEGMPEGDRPSVDVELVPLDAQMAGGWDHLSGEGLVDLDQVDVADLHARPSEGLAAGLDRPEPHDLRIDPGDARRR